MFHFYNNYFRDFKASDYIKDKHVKLSDAYIQILMSKAVADRVVSIIRYDKYIFDRIINKLNKFLKDNGKTYFNKIALYKKYSPETIAVSFESSALSEKVPVMKELSEMFFEHWRNHMELFELEEFNDQDWRHRSRYQDFCRYSNQEIYDGYFVYIDSTLLFKLAEIDKAYYYTLP